MTTQVTIHQSQIPVVEYQGKRVVTFAMIDEVHQRPSGTASRNFKSNRNRFISEQDFYLLDSKGLDEFRTSGIFGESAHRGVLITESGYLMLVKSLTDDLAWTVQRELVNDYFKPAIIEQSTTFQIPTTLSEALLLAGKLAAENENKDKQLEAQKPAVAFAMNIRNMDGCCSVEDFAKTTGYGRNTYFKMLREDGFLMKNNAPYQRYIDSELFKRIEVEPYKDKQGELHPVFMTVITGKGQAVLEKKYRKNGGDL